MRRALTLKTKQIGCGILLTAVLLLFFDRVFLGYKLDSYKGVPIFYNGIFMFLGYGKHYSPNGYYFGPKWQCVEFIKRFYYQYYRHEMSNTMGRAIHYFNSELADGSLNSERNMIQYRNGSNVLPKEDDLLVFSNFSHVALISKVYKDKVEIIQQNQFLRSRKFLKMEIRNNQYFLGDGKDTVAGWLRMKVVN
jgi:hypothetical protein